MRAIAKFNSQQRHKSLRETEYFNVAARDLGGLTDWKMICAECSFAVRKPG